MALFFHQYEITHVWVEGGAFLRVIPKFDFMIEFALLDADVSVPRGIALLGASVVTSYGSYSGRDPLQALCVDWKSVREDRPTKATLCTLSADRMPSGFGSRVSVIKHDGYAGEVVPFTQDIMSDTSFVRRATKRLLDLRSDPIAHRRSKMRKEINALLRGMWTNA